VALAWATLRPRGLGEAWVAVPAAGLLLRVLRGSPVEPRFAVWLRLGLLAVPFTLVAGTAALWLALQV
jgi:hypothetical protein